MVNVVPIEKIQIGQRQRKSVGELDDLIESIKRVGLIHPIVVDSDLNLLAGERRLTACKMLGWNEVPIRQFNELGETERKEIELEENIRRKNLDWQEEVKAKLELDKLKRELYGSGQPGQVATSGWRLKDTATSLGESVGNVSMDLQVAKALEKFPDLLNVSSKTQAYKRYKQLLDRTIREALVEHIDVNDINDVENGATLLHGDCIELMREMPEESVDLIITDPPYGVAVDTSKVGREYIGTFDDSKDNWFDIVKVALDEMYRVLKVGGHMYMFFGTRNHVETMQLLDDSYFEYDSISCIWYKGRMAGFPYNPKKRFRYCYEPFWFCWKGESKYMTADVGCVFEVPLISGGSKTHPTEKPFELGRQLMELSSIEGEVVLDPFAGSGGLILAAHQNKRRVIAIEKDQDYFNILKERFNHASNKHND